MNRRVFVEWLEAHATEEVGQVSSSETCPAAKWMQSRGHRAEVFQYNSLIDGERTANPEWLRDFIEIVDGAEGGMMLTGEDCLAILDSIP